MLRQLVEFTIKYRKLVLVLTLFLALFGVLALFNLPFDAFPDTTPVLVQVNVAAPGWAPEDLERLVTYPLEQVLTGLSGLTEVRSVTKYGLSQITIIFEDGVDLYLARQQVSERLISAELPESVGSPQLGPVSTGLGEIFHYVVTSESDDIAASRTAQDWIIKPQMLAVPGVAEVNSWGGFEKQYLILFEPDRLSQYNLTLHEVVERIDDELGNVPGGQIIRSGEMTIIRGIGTVENIEQIKNIVIASIESIPITVSQIGDVVIGHEIRRGATTYNGKGEAVLGLGFMITGENPAEITGKLSERLSEIQAALPDDITVEPVYERTDLVAKVLKTVEHNLLFGALLVIAILFIFLGSFRAGLIVASAIPLSMLFAFDMMERFAIAGSLMSLGAIDFGLAVDNAVIQVENAVRRLSGSNTGKSKLEIIRDAILEVRKPTLFGELIIIIVYLPILTLEGVEGKLFRPMALTVVFVLTGSLLMSFTVIPALIATFLKKGIKDSEPKFLIWLKNIYKPIVTKAVQHAKFVVSIAAVLVICGIILFSRIGSEFVPRLNEGTIVVNFVRLAGISLEDAVKYNTKIEQNLLEQFPNEISHIWTRLGTAELSTDPMGIELSDMFMSLHPRENWTKVSSQEELVAAIDAELADLPGQNRIFTQPIEMRVNEMIAGIRSDIGIKIFGDDLTYLEEKAEEVAALVETINGAADVSVEQLTGQPQLEISVDRERLARFGLTSREVLTVIESIGGIKVGDVYENQRSFDLAIRIDTTQLDAPEDVGEILLSSSSGSMISLDRLTTSSLTPGPATITREWSKRRIVVQCNVRDRDLGSFVSELKERLSGVPLSEDSFIRRGGEFENLERA
ncbi:MAG: AcrB/AcrD/AcrF family protein, partial [Calditrichaeota bacterium]